MYAKYLEKLVASRPEKTITGFKLSFAKAYTFESVADANTTLPCFGECFTMNEEKPWLFGVVRAI